MLAIACRKRTGRRGEIGAGRSGPDQQKSGIVMLRAWPRLVQNSQLSGPGLCARLCSGQARCALSGTELRRGCIATMAACARTGAHLEAVLGAEGAGRLRQLQLQALGALQLGCLPAPGRPAERIA